MYPNSTTPPFFTQAFGGKQPTTTEHTTPIPIPPPPSGMNVSMTTSLSSIDFTSEPTQQTPTNGQQTPVAASSPEEQLSWLAKGKALIKVLQPAYWQAMVVVCILYFARFDAGFITLRAKSVWCFVGVLLVFLLACGHPPTTHPLASHQTHAYHHITDYAKGRAPPPHLHHDGHTSADVSTCRHASQAICQGTQ